MHIMHFITFYQVVMLSDNVNNNINSVKN